MNEKFMTEHPLRPNLKDADWERIQIAFDSGDLSQLTSHEIDAANDLLLDEVSARMQTHLSIWALH